jgi:hypothetical protein
MLSSFLCSCLLFLHLWAAHASPTTPFRVQQEYSHGADVSESQPSRALPDLYEASISDLQKFLSNGSFTSVDLTKASWLVFVFGLAQHDIIKTDSQTVRRHTFAAY